MIVPVLFAGRINGDIDMTLSKAELIAAVREHAVANYEKDGFDFLVECWSDDDIAEAIKGAKTKTAAISAARKAVKVLADARDDARAAGDADATKAEKPARAPRRLEDRVLVEPGNPEDVKPTKEGSKRALLVTALARGTTVEHLMDLLGWNRPTVTSAIYSDVRAIGLGVERRDGKYFLLLPEGMNALPLREAAKRRAKAHEASK